MQFRFIKKAMILAFLVLPASCSSEATSYNKICDIYKNVIKQEASLDDKEVFITKSMYEQFPDFFEGNFKYISRSDPDERYELLKSTIELNISTTWECEAARNYYATEFNKKK